MMMASLGEEILKHKPTPQMSYQAAFCFWLLSFEQEVAENINKCVLYFACTLPLFMLQCPGTSTSYHY